MITGEQRPSPSLKDVMTFLTGCDYPPPLGYGEIYPSITFSESIALPSVSTCGLTLTFPWGFPTDSRDFKELDVCDKLRHKKERRRKQLTSSQALVGVR